MDRLLHFLVIGSFLVTSGFCQTVSWCKDEECGDCPSGLTSDGPGYPECVIYDSNVVFGGQGFATGEGDIEFKPFGSFGDPCSGAPGSIMVRSPASLTQLGCGNLIYHTQQPTCSGEIQLQDTFMIQFCCGVDDCKAAGVPYGKRSDDEFSQLSLGGGIQGAYLKFANGTEIEPIAVGSPVNAAITRRSCKVRRQDDCKGYKDNSYIAAGEPYLSTFDIQIVANGVAASEEDRSIMITYDQTVSTSTSFDVSVGDPFGIVSVSVGFEFSESTTTGVTYSLSVPAGQSGRVGFTPAFQCTDGTLETCDGVRTPESQSCTPYLNNAGTVQGDYTIVAT